MKPLVHSSHLAGHLAHRLAVPLLTVLLMAPDTVSANDSIYTDLDTDHCQTLSPEDEEGGGISLRCKGFKDYAVYYKEGDLRQSLFYGHLGQAYIDGAFESFGPFNYTSRRIEWRLGADGRPVATILRWFIENADPATGEPAPERKGQVLVISKVAGEDGIGCVAGYVDALANPDPNIAARQIADTQTEGFACGRDTAAFHGVRGPTAADPTGDLPE